jgi:hypothetical protein
MFLCWLGSLIGGMLVTLCLWSSEGDENSIALVRMMVMSVIIVLGVQVIALEGSAWLAVIMRHMMVGVAPATAAWARAGTRARRRSWTRATPFSEQGVCAWWRGLVIMHGLVTHFLEVIAFAITLLLVGLFVLVVLVFTMRVIMVSLSWWQLSGHWPLRLYRLLQW